MLILMRKEQGFSLIELMVVVAIVAILTTIAYGSYQGQVTRSNRAAAVGFVLEVASRQERFLLDNRQYAASLAALNMTVPQEVAGNYNVTTVTPEPGNAAPAPSYRVTAAPTGNQLANDTACGTLTLNHLGQRSASGPGDRCWR